MGITIMVMVRAGMARFVDRVGLYGYDMVNTT